jgi:hypothetical protein
VSDELLSTLYNRHAAALSVVAAGADRRVHIDAALMALALMARELADKLHDIHQANGGSGEKRVDLRTYEWLNDQIARINDWLAENEVGLYHDPHTDTADAIIAAASGTRAGLQNAFAANRNLVELLEFTKQERDDLREDLDSVRRELETLLAERDDLRKKVEWREFELEKANAAIHGNGKSQPAAVLMQALDAAPALDWSSLSQAAQDYRIGLDAGRWKWRDIPKSTLLELVRCVIRNAGHMPTQAQFDAVRPSWMATADAQKTAFGVQWGILANLDREIEVAP